MRPVLIFICLFTCAFARAHAHDGDLRSPPLFSTQLPKEPTRARNYFWPPLASFILPGFDQWWEGQTKSAIAYSGSALIGFELAVQSANSAGSGDQLTSRDNSLRSYTLGNQLYMAAGSFSAYHSFRSAVNSRKSAGQFSFLSEEETTGDLLVAPLHFSYLVRPTTYIPLLVGLAFAAIETSQDSQPFMHNGFSGADAGFGAGFSYLAGSNEEALFRGYIMPALQENLDQAFWSNTITALLFASAHISSDNPVPWPQFILGWYLGEISQRNHWTLSENIFIHAWWDVIAFTAGYLHESRDPRYKATMVPLVNVTF